MQFTEQNIQKWVLENYGMKVGVKALNGYEELNFLLKDDVGNQYLLKAGSEELGRGFIEAQLEMLQHLEQTNLQHYFQKVIPTLDGKVLSEINQNGNRYYVRMLTFLTGEFWYALPHKSKELHENLGRFLGKMDFELNRFSHPSLHRRHTWDISTAQDASKKMHFIKNHHKRRIADYFLLQFETEVLPKISSLRHAYVHNDANDYNVMVSDNAIVGLIDFGDAVYTALINNLAIACTYAMLHEEDPLTVAENMVKGYHSAYSLTSEEVDLLYYLIATRLVISVTQSALNASIESNNEHHFLTEKPGWDLLEKWIKINPAKAKNQFRIACGFESIFDEKNDYSSLLDSRKEHVGRNLSISYKRPLKIEKSALQYLYDDKGNTYVDCVNNVSHVGHCHPRLVRVMQKQIATLNTNTRYLNDWMMQYAKSITEMLPKKLSVCYFTNSGSEANDLAIRMSRHFTRQKDVIVLDHAYHGTSTTAIEMSPYKFDGKGGFVQKEYIHKAQSPDLYRGEYTYSDADAGIKYAQSVGSIIADMQTKGMAPAAFICETLLGVGGQIPLPDNYLKEVYQIVRNAGGICIADEVQVGFGRVGDAFWGFELQGVEPDIVVLGKPIGNGHPLAAVIVTEEIANAFNNGMEYFNTFGGNPVSMATGQTVLEIIREEELQQHAKETGEYLMSLLKDLMNRFPLIGDVRGHGLFVGAELVTDRNTKEPAIKEIGIIVERMKDKGYLLSTDGPLNNVLKIKPPLVFTKENADEMVKLLEEVLVEF